MSISVLRMSTRCCTTGIVVSSLRACPNPHKEDGEIEIWQMFELEDFGASEAVEHHRRLAEQIAKK